MKENSSQVADMDNELKNFLSVSFESKLGTHPIAIGLVRSIRWSYTCAKMSFILCVKNDLISCVKVRSCCFMGH